MTDGPFTVAYAKQLAEEEHVHTGGCWRCVQNALVGTPYRKGSEKTQWKQDSLKEIGHRMFCPQHYREEMQGERDF